MGVFLNSCEKKPFDPRNKYVGEYEFTSIIHTYDYVSSNSSWYHQIREVIYKGSVKLHSSNEIVVDFLPEEYHFVDGNYNNNTRIADGKLYVDIDDNPDIIRISENSNIEFGFGGNYKVPSGSINVSGKRL